MAAPGGCACSMTRADSATNKAWTKIPRLQIILAKEPLLTSEEELQRYLHYPRIQRLGNIAESTLARVVDKPVGIFELRMVENVKGFRSKLQLGVFGDRSALQQSHIPIVDSGSGEITP